ncbi:hypothetical protein [Devosia sp. A449]
MPFDEQTSMMITEELVSSLEKVISKIEKSFDDLRAETGVQIINGFDPDRTGYRKGQLASNGGGSLWQFTGPETGWRTITNGVESVKIEGDWLVVERSNGVIEKSQIKKTTRAKTVKVETV